jgi:hypothetical protein
MLPAFRPDKDDPPEMMKWIRQGPNYIMMDDILYWKGHVGEDQEVVIQLVLPQEHRQEAMEFCHDKMGHFRKERMMALLKDRFYWMGMETDVEAYLNPMRQVPQIPRPARSSAYATIHSEWTHGPHPHGFSEAR